MTASSSQFTKLAARVSQISPTPDHEEPAMFEISGNDRAQNPEKRNGCRWQHADIILVKQGAGKSTLLRHPCDTASSAMLDFVVDLLYRAGSAIASALPLRFLFRCWPIPRPLHLARFREISAPGRTQCCYWRLPMKSRRANCAALCAGIFSLALTCFAAQTNANAAGQIPSGSNRNIESMASRVFAQASGRARFDHLGTWDYSRKMPKFVGYVANASVYQKTRHLSLTRCARRAANWVGIV